MPTKLHKANDFGKQSLCASVFSSGKWDHETDLLHWAAFLIDSTLVPSHLIHLIL